MSDMPVQKFTGPPSMSPFQVTVRGETYNVEARDTRDAIVRVLSPLGLRWGCEKVTVVPVPQKPKKEFASLRRVK